MITDLLLLSILGVSLDGHVPRMGAGRKKPMEDLPTVRDALIESLLKIRIKGRGVRKFRLNRAQREYSRTCGRRNIVLKARQLGITTYVAGRFFVQTVTQPGTLSVQVAHTQESAEEIFRIVHRFLEKLPEPLRRGALATSHANIRQIVFPKLDSEYRIATAADPNAGRGMTIHHLHCSEVARWPRGGEEVLASLRAAVPDSGEIVLESTPNGAAGVFYEEWQRADETGYTKHFFPWWYDDHYTIEDCGNVLPLTPEEAELATRVPLSDAQVAWRRKMWSELRGLAAQEYAEDPAACFKASGECVFDLDAIDAAMKARSGTGDSSDNGRMRIWLPAQPGKQYIVGVDPAGGGSEGDYACATVIEREMGMQCAEFHGHFPPREFASQVIKLGRSYNDALIAVERNNHGHAVLSHLRTMEYPNVFMEGREDGWLTTAATRPAMIENLAEVLIAQPTLFHSERFLNECRTFVRHVDGSAAAAVGTHDDTVMAMAVALAVRKKVAGRVAKVVYAKLPSLLRSDG